MDKENTILFVEDDRWSIAPLIDSLKFSGFSVMHAFNASEAKEIINNTTIDLVVLDVMMSYGDSFEDNISSKAGFRSGIVLGAWIKKHFPNIPFIGYSVVNDEDVISWFKKNSIGYIFKHSSDKKVEDLIISTIKGTKINQYPKTFIVHGHDDLAKYELKNYIQNSLNFAEPIILHEQPSLGRNIIEKFEDEAIDVDIVFVLLTPDDKVYNFSDPNSNKLRARQNVIFEMGYFLGKLTRTTGRVILLYKGLIEIPSDISGLIYIDISNGIEASGELIRKELSSFLVARPDGTS